MKQKLLTLATLLLCAVSGAWATDIVDKYTGIKFNTSTPGQNVAVLTYGGDVTISSSSLQVDKGKTGTFTLTVKPTGYVIKSIKFHEKSASKVSNLSSEQGTISDIDGENWFTFTPTANDCTTATISYQGNGGKAQIDQVWTTLTNGDDNDSESLVFTEADDSDPKNLTFTSTLGASTKITTCTSSGSGIGDNSGIKGVKIGNGRNVRIVASQPIKKVLFSWYQRCPASDSDWTGDTGSFDYENCTWTAANSSTTDVTFTRNVGSEAQLTNIHIIYQPGGPQDATFTISKTTIAPSETAKILVDGEDKFAANFTAGTLWESETGGPYIELSSDGIVTAVKNTPAGYYFTFTANSKDLDKYNSAAGVHIDVAVATPTCATPTITKGDFNFENKGYAVTMTNNEDGSTLKYSIDNANWYDYSGTLYATATTHYYAKSIKASYNDSDVADLEVENTFAPAKPYVAWAYTKGYGSKSYAFATDPMVIALQAIYNVVEVDNAADVAPAADLANADLIVCTEAMTGNKAFSNGMKTFVGTTPMIGLKAFNYTKGRWSWGTPANPGSTTTCFMPKSNTYKVLDGVAFEPDGSIKLATAASGNVIQTVQFGTTDTTAPDGNVIMGNIDNSDNKAVMHAATKYFGLGLSCDAWDSYTDNAVTIVKNAAALLLAGESLTGEDAGIDREVSQTITAYGWSTIASVFALDFASEPNLEAYMVTGHTGSAIIKTQVTGTVPANTPLLVYGKTGEGNYNVTVVASSSTDVSANKLKAGTGADVEAESGKTKYVLSVNGGKAAFKKINATAATVPVGKAYLQFDEVISAPLFDLDDETTSIKAVEAKTVENDEYFNLAGQRVAQPTKGLYIVNGKKVIIK